MRGVATAELLEVVVERLISTHRCLAWSYKCSSLDFTLFQTCHRARVYNNPDCTTKPLEPLGLEKIPLAGSIITVAVIIGQTLLV